MHVVFESNQEKKREVADQEDPQSPQSPRSPQKPEAKKSVLKPQVEEKVPEEKKVAPKQDKKKKKKTVKFSIDDVDSKNTQE